MKQNNKKPRKGRKKEKEERRYVPGEENCMSSWSYLAVSHGEGLQAIAIQRSERICSNCALLTHMLVSHLFYHDVSKGLVCLWISDLERVFYAYDTDLESYYLFVSLDSLPGLPPGLCLTCCQRNLVVAHAGGLMGHGHCYPLLTCAILFLFESSLTKHKLL